jgi:hypothetical protein
LPDPPYPADVNAIGYRPQMDLRRIKQSRTWMLADPEVRPWLVLLWLEAWESIPAGTFPADDDAVIAARIGCKAEWFNGHRDQLMRGWRRHADGNLYHPVITDLVLDMVGRRQGAAARQARFREANSGRNETAESNALLTRESRVSNGESHGSNGGKGEVNKYSSSLRSDESAVVAKKPRRAAPPTADILRLWSEILPDLPQPIDPAYWTPTRKAQIAARWADQLPDLDAWRDLFERIAESRFLTGKTTRPFKADLFWATKPENLLRIHEGRYA